MYKKYIKISIVLLPMLKNKILMTKMEIIANYSFSGISLKQLSEKNEVDKRWSADPQSVHSFFGDVLFLMVLQQWLSSCTFPAKTITEIMIWFLLMNFLLSYLVPMRIKTFNPCIIKIYVGVLQALKWTMKLELSLNIQNVYAVEIKVRFMETLIHKLEEIVSVSTLSRIVFLNHQMATLVEMLKFLRANLI
uniref:Late blight resistance protein R1A-like N-terminal domain-containing protein n=1 Tax=Solanum lycopersicum TaxID=4081 RepID=A0A3Q7GG15_SOLLC